MTEVEDVEWELQKLTVKQKKFFVAGYALSEGNLRLMCGKDPYVTLSKRTEEGWINFSMSVNEFVKLCELEPKVFDVYNALAEDVSPKEVALVDEEYIKRLDNIAELYVSLRKDVDEIKELLKKKKK